MSEQHRVRAAVVFAVMLAAAAVALLWRADPAGPRELVLGGTLSLMAFAARMFPLQVAFRRRMVTDTAPLFAAAVLLEPGHAMVVALAGVGAAEVLCAAGRRPDPRQVLFNASQAALGVAAGSLVFAWAADPSSPGEGAGPAVGLLAAAAMLAANDALVFIVVWAQLGLRLDRMAWDFVRGRGDLPYDLALYGLGFIGAVAGGESPWLLPLFALPAPAVYRAMRNQVALRVQTREAVTALADAVDDRDPYTFGHCRRVAGFSAAICSQLGLSPDLSDEIVLAARVHDVGKIGIRDAVLLKSTKLTNDEFDHIKQHPDIGARLTARFPDFARGTRYIRHHHERWDGSGYPAGLRGREIPLGARIIAVADTYDAMASTRVYRPGLDDDTIHAEMARVAGAQLDPDVVAAWFRHQGRPFALLPQPEDPEQAA